MKVTRKSSLSGIVRTKDLDITSLQVERYINKSWLLQEAFPHLSPEDREFIKTGITGEEWDQMFGGME